jgi:hypothetical protein
MWKRKALKRNAKQVLKSNYLSIITTCVLVMLILGNFTNPIDAFESVKDTYMSKLNDTLLFDENKDESISKVEYAENAVQDVSSKSEIISDFIENVEPVKHGEQKWTHGAIATIINNTDGTDSLVYGVLNTINQLVFKMDTKFTKAVLILLGTIIYIIIGTLINGNIAVGYCRYLLENRAYTKTKMSRILFSWSVKQELHIAWVILVKTVYQYLWWLTVIGGIIKKYSYRLVPQILAENPTLSATEAITLSRQMMKGNKFRVFWLDVSFLGWKILNRFTFSTLNIFFLQPYISLTDAELYIALRDSAKADNIPNADKLCDSLLEVAPSATRYPEQSYMLPPARSRKWLESDYNRSYSPYSLILMFFTFSFIGWLWEVSLHLFTSGIFVNRGVCHGPWLPIYGFGGVLVLIVLKKLRHNPILTFIAAMGLSGIVEYGTSVYLEVTKGMKWWDYSGYFLNINGRICLEGLLVFAFGGCICIYLIAPALDNLFSKIPLKYKREICAILLALFIGDQIYSNLHPNSGFGITDYD